MKPVGAQALFRRLARRGPSAAYQPAHDDRTPLPAGAEEYLQRDNPRLVELRETYERLDWPVLSRSRWGDGMLDQWLHLAWFRGDNPYVWQYRLHDEHALALRYFVFLRYVLDRDPLGLVAKLGEDGSFGCWTFRYEGYPSCSRDLLDSVNELYFLDRQLAVLDKVGMRILDIGAGYGRLAHRWSQAAPGLADYCCTDAVPVSTFLSEYYTRFLGLGPIVRVAPLPAVPDLAARSFDLAVNIHSFSECTYDAIAWWINQVSRLEIPHLFLVPNEEEGFLTLEEDGSRVDYLQAIQDSGYRLIAEEPAFVDPAVRDLMMVRDRLCLFERC